ALHTHGIKVDSAKEAALALAPLAGPWASTLFAIGLLNASLFSASILPLSTAYFICEAFGIEAGIDKSWGEAPAFYWLYTILIIIGAGFILIPNIPLIKVMFWSQVLNGVMLPFVLIFMLKLINNRDLMGDYVNSRTFNIIAWVTTVIMIALTLLMVATSLLQP
ncbi:MAG: divalent metal cation transporter, partial [Desulfobaccales bacterium]